MMPAPEIARRIIAALNSAAIPHVMVGSFARNFYAEPRSTKDADVVIALSGGTLRPFLDALGADFQLDDQMAFETNTGTLKHVLAHPDSGFTVELFYLSDDPHDQERFHRRRLINYDGLPTSVLTAEDYIVTKLRWSRSKDLDDVRDVIAVQGDEGLDWNYIHRWTALHGTRAKLDEIRSSIPKLD